MKNNLAKTVLLTALLSTSLVAQQRGNVPGDGNRAVPARGENRQLEKPRSAAENPSYVIGPADVLEVSVWNEAAFSRSVVVRPDGKISLPLINEIQASGLQPTQLAAVITEKLKKYVTQPQVTVVVVQMNSQRVYVLGEVNRPGPMPLLPDMTILQAISVAGGLGQFANAKKIYLMRSEGGKQVRYPFNYKSALKGEMAQNLALKSGDTIVVP